MSCFRRIPRTVRLMVVLAMVFGLVRTPAEHAQSDASVPAAWAVLSLASLCGHGESAPAGLPAAPHDHEKCMVCAAGAAPMLPVGPPSITLSGLVTSVVPASLVLARASAAPIVLAYASRAPPPAG
jgi:hypothetical protein